MKNLIELMTIVIAAAASPALAELRLPAIISDHMMLQADVPARIWGDATPGVPVTVSFAGQSVAAAADDEGRWSVQLGELSPTSEGSPLVIEGDGERLEIDDVVVGEVWLCGGQSNMEWPVGRTTDAQPLPPASGRPTMRLFDVAFDAAWTPADDVES